MVEMAMAKDYKIGIVYSQIHRQGIFQKQIGLRRIEKNLFPVELNKIR
jgi:hypothetical protein